MDREGNPRIQVIEDDESMASMRAILLERDGFEVKKGGPLIIVCSTGDPS